MARDQEKARVESRGWTAWSALLRFSRSPLVVYGTYATLLVPLLAHGIVFASRMWGVAKIPTPPGAMLDSPALSLSWLGVDAPLGWRIFVLLFYFGGLLLMLGRLLTDVFCPQRIQRFPYEDDHLRYIGGIKEAKLRIQEALGDEIGERDDDDAVRAALEALLKRQGETAEAINAKWRDENTSRRPLRGFITGLYAVGTSLIVIFLGWRMLDNFLVVVETLPFSGIF